MSQKFEARKSLGQHFLINKQLCRQIVNLLEPSANDNILEIGPGQGALSKLLLSAPVKSLFFLEKDWRFASLLANSSSSNVILMDALDFNWRKLTQAWKIVGNLPYNIASSLIWNILAQTPGLQRAVFMVQQEVAHRISAAPGSRQYGALSVWCQSHAECKLEINVSPGSFRPPPKVFSSVLSFVPHSAERRPKKPEKLKFILNLFFQQRRKQLGAIIKKSSCGTLSEVLSGMDINLSLRPENLGPDQYIQISNNLQ